MKTLFRPVTSRRRRAIYNNQFFAANVATTISQLGTAIREVSGNKALSSFFYGYMNALEEDLTHSGHTALDQLQKSTSVDMVAGPYSYKQSRTLGTAMTAQGVIDSAPLRGKLYVHEDDTLTSFCQKYTWGCAHTRYYEGIQSDTPYRFYSADPSRPANPYIQQAGTLTQTLNFMRRNFVSAGIRKAGTYLFRFDERNCICGYS